jgi:hypothetical protein
MPMVRPLIGSLRRRCVIRQRSCDRGRIVGVRARHQAQQQGAILGVRASGPTVSSDCDSGIAPARLMRPTVVFNPVTPQKCAGIRIEPPVSEPSAAKVSRAATAAPIPTTNRR